VHQLPSCTLNRYTRKTLGSAALTFFHCFWILFRFLFVRCYTNRDYPNNDCQYIRSGPTGKLLATPLYESCSRNRCFITRALVIYLCQNGISIITIHSCCGGSPIFLQRCF